MVETKNMNMCVFIEAHTNYMHVLYSLSGHFQEIDRAMLNHPFVLLRLYDFDLVFVPTWSINQVLAAAGLHPTAASGETAAWLLSNIS